MWPRKEVIVWDEEFIQGPPPPSLPVPRAQEAGRSSRAVGPPETQVRTTSEWLSHFLGKIQSTRCQDCLAVKSTGFRDVGLSPWSDAKNL